MIQRALRWAVAAAVASMLVGLPARASIFDDVGITGRDAAMAGAVTADDTDYTAVFYNPAMLVLQTKVGFGLGGVGVQAFSHVDSNDATKTLDCTYCGAPFGSGFHLGLLFPLGGKVKNYVSLGALVYKPSFRLVHVQAEDPSRPMWYRYQSEDRFIAFFGAGIKIVDGLSIGIGIQVLADLVGNGATVRTDLFNKTFQMREIDSYLANTLSPNAGIYWAPDPSFRLGLDFRGERSLYYEVPAMVDLAGVATLAFKIHGYTHYTPHTFTLGAAWKPEDDLTLTADLEYMLWSRAPTPYVQVEINVSGDVLKALGLEDALAMQSKDLAPGFQNTLVAKAGVEYQAADGFFLRGGAFYRPTMVPRQDVSETNILDSNTLGLTGGIGLAFMDPLEVFQEPITLDLALQAAYMLPRTANKPTTDPLPPYSYSAVVAGGAIDLRYDF